VQNAPADCGVAPRRTDLAVVSVDLRFHGENKVAGRRGNANREEPEKRRGKKSQGWFLKQDDYLAWSKPTWCGQVIHLRRTPGGKPEHDQDGDRRPEWGLVLLSLRGEGLG